jgi:hypothetical protein
LSTELFTNHFSPFSVAIFLQPRCSVRSVTGWPCDRNIARASISGGRDTSRLVAIRRVASHVAVGLGLVVVHDEWGKGSI